MIATNSGTAPLRAPNRNKLTVPAFELVFGQDLAKDDSGTTDSLTS